ncbi:glycosyltransferase family 9 protein [Desulfoferrobacter suflitae]|uniref:glycosyltransferase family 9 protein n=1 Tax=Desulfoferrobacter suflitae TaxID=2865782 RepID=UPI0021648EE3|nr:glycosyltransferase family 9 protein [Desulfoferrobacter suflitae]MCK8603853.1 glycosyltransferase family 9 protein [Desulfoferrobacter suflitae]
MLPCNPREKLLEQKALEDAAKTFGLNMLLTGAPRLGDLLFACPAIDYLMANDAVDRLTVLSYGYAAPILDGLTGEVEHIELPGSSWNPLGKWRLVRTINRRNYDAAIVLDGKKSMRKLLAATNIPLILVETPTAMHKTWQHFASMLRTFPSNGLWNEPEYRTPGIRVTHRAQAWALTRLQQISRPRVAFHVGCRRVGRKKLCLSEVNRTATKLWPVERFMELGRKLIHRFGASIVMVGSGTTEQALADRFAAVLGPACVNAVNWGDSMQTAALLQQSDLLVASDGGILHLGAAVGLKVVAVWGPTPYEIFGPCGSPDKIRVLRKEAACSPCKKRTCDDKVCLRSISAEEALAAAGELMQRQNDKPGSYRDKNDWLFEAPVHPPKDPH